MKLNKVYNSIIPFEGYLAITVWPWVFIRKDCADKYDDMINLMRDKGLI